MSPVKPKRRTGNPVGRPRAVESVRARQTMVRLTEEEWLAWSELAEREGRPLGNWVRRMVELQLAAPRK